MNRKMYLISMITIIVVSVGLIVTNAIYTYMDWIWVFVVAAVGYMYMRYRLSGPLQLFSTKFNMLVDYDLDLEGATEMASTGLKNAPTKNIASLYQMYLGMAHYYSGNYEEAIKTFHLIELKRMNPVYHVLIFAFSAYSAFELENQEEFTFSIERIRNIQPRISQRYQGFARSYLEILEALQNIDTNLDQYKEVIEKHFGNPDGYISTRLIYHYRLALYYQKANDPLEMDKNLAFVIANGKEHHTALQAKRMFKGSVSIDDYLLKDEPVVEEQPVLEAEISEPETPEDSESDKE